MTRFKKSILMRNKIVASSQQSVVRVLGIDPGFARIGIAILEHGGSKEKLIHSECFETKPNTEHAKRLSAIATRLRSVIREFKPNELAIETLLWSKNKKTALQVAEARGVILLVASEADILIREFNPNQVKLSVTGYGKSDKKQIIFMLHKLIKIPAGIKHDDEYDAIAIGLTALATKLSTDRY